MADGGGTSLGNFYFDVMFRDKTQGVLQNIKDALNRIDKDITINISSKNIGGDVKKIQTAINQKLASIKASVPILLSNNALEQVQKLAAALQGQTVQIGVMLKYPTKENLNAIKQRVKSMVIEIDAVIKDVQDAKIKAIKNSIERRLRVDAKVNATTATSSLQQALKSRKFKFDVVVDQMRVARAVQAALTQAGLNGATGLTAAQARAQRALNQAAESQARINRQNSESLAREAALRQKTNAQIAVSEQKKRTEIEKTNAAQAKAVQAQARATAATQRNTAANNQNAASYMLIRKSMLQSIPLAGSLANMARNYVGVFGAVSAVRSLYRIRAEFERQEVALRALMQSASQARQVMGELQAMALKSPFSVTDIVSFSKQLSAFSIGNNELVETTKRLADLSAGLGVDMSRLILAYGQVKAATVLRGQELRQFTEAGVPMVRALADEFTKLEGRVVTAADVFERISKKQVSFEMVKQVLDSMTGEGGRFYDHQAKMVETLYGKLERMGDAYKVMMNQLGASNDSLLKAPIDTITKAMQDWRSTIRSIITMISAGGIWKLVNALKTPPALFSNITQQSGQLLQDKQIQSLNMLYSRGGLGKLNANMQRYVMLSNTMTKADWQRLAIQKKLTKSETMYLYTTGRLSAEQVKLIAKTRQWNLAQQQTLLNMNAIQRQGMRAGIAITRLAASFRAFAMQALPVAIITMFVDLIAQIIQAKQEIDDFNTQVRSSAKDTVDDLRSYLDSHKEVFDMVVNPDIKQDPETLKKTWEDLKEKIEQLPDAEIIIGVAIKDGSDDLKKMSANAIEFLRTMERVGDEVNNLDTRLSFTQDTWFWGAFGEGAKSDLKDFDAALAKIRKEITSMNEWLRHNKIDFQLNLSNFNTKNVEWVFRQGYNNNINYARALVQDYNDALSEAGGEISKSLKDSLLPAFKELRDKGVNTPEEIAAAYRQLMPQIKEGIGAVTKEQKEMVEMMAYDMLKNAGYAIDELALLGTNAASDLRVRVEREAQNMGLNINEIIDSGNTDLMNKLLVAAQNNAKDATDYARRAFDMLRNYIQSNPAYFRVIMHYEVAGSGEALNYLKKLNAPGPGPTKNFNPSERYGTSTPNADDSHDKAIKAAQDNYNAALSEERQMQRNIKKLQQAGKDTTEEAEKLADIRKNKQGALNLLNDYGVQPELKGENKPKKTKKTGGGSKRDTWLDEVRNRFKEYKEARSEIEKLKKAGFSTTKAIDEVLKMSWSEPLERKYLEKGGAKELFDYLIPYVENHAKGLKGAAKQAVMNFKLELQKEANGETVRITEEATKSFGEALKKRIEVGVKNWKLYDTLFEATGDEAMSAQAAFGGKKLFKNLEDQLISIFNENQIGIKFDEALKMDDKSLKEAFGDGNAYLELLQKINDVHNSSWDDVIGKIAKYYETTMTQEQKLEAVRARHQRERKEYLAHEGTSTSDAGYKALIAGQEREMQELQQEAVKLSQWWQDLFDSLNEETIGSLNRTINEYGPALEKAFKTSDGRYISYINGKAIFMNEGTYREALKRIQTLKKKLREASLTQYLKDLFGNEGLWAKADTMSEKLGIVANAMGRINDAAGKALKASQELFSALGMEGEADAAELAQKMLDSVQLMAQGMSQIFGGDTLGGAANIATATASMVEAVDWIWEQSKKREIAKISREAELYGTIYDQLSKTIERSLGGIYQSGKKIGELREWIEKSELGENKFDELTKSGSTYQSMLESLKKQYDKVKEARAAEQKMKNPDESALADYDKNLLEIQDSIAHFAEDMAKELYDIDVKSWAKELTDAIVSAWQNGENAAEAYKDKVKEIIADVTKNIISQKIMEMALTPVLNAIVEEMTAKNGMLDEQSLLRFANALGEAGTGAVNTITGVLDKMKALGYDLTSTTTTAGTLGQGIKDITEDQANLLASYINAMRADLSVIRFMWEEHNAGTSVVAQAQLSQLTMIAENTLRNADTADRIETALNSVITIGASGARLRV